MDIRLFPPGPCMGRLFDIRQSENTARPLKRRRQIVWIAASLEPPSVKVKAAGGHFRRQLLPKLLQPCAASCSASPETPLAKQPKTSFANFLAVASIDTKSVV